jgi:hypothetical protein
LPPSATPALREGRNTRNKLAVGGNVSKPSLEMGRKVLEGKVRGLTGPAVVVKGALSWEIGAEYPAICIARRRVRLRFFASCLVHALSEAHNRLMIAKFEFSLRLRLCQLLPSTGRPVKRRGG